MESMLNLRVHIAPVGFEIDRVVVPAVKMKADLVYLVADVVMLPQTNPQSFKLK